MMRRTVTFVSVLVACFFAATSLQAATYTVDDDGPADFSTIQAAISATSSGDIVQVFPGVYNEHVQLKDGVYLFGSGPDVTTIDGGASPSGGWPTVTAANDSIIAGFKIVHGYDGVKCVDCSAVIMNNIISQNYGDGGIVIIAKSLSVGGLVINNTITENIGNVYNSYIPIGIYVEVEDGGGIEASPVIVNNIVTENAYGISPYFATPVLSYNDVWGNSKADYGYGYPPGKTDISKDPLFANSDYHLAEGSPCIDEGAPGTEYNDPDGTRNDMGAYGGPGAAGGRSSFSGSGFIFTSIGKIPTSEITQDAANPSHGLANVSDKVADDFKIPKYLDSPFGGNLWIHGLFGDKDNVDYYQILAGKWINGEPPGPDDYVCLKDPLTKVRYVINPDGTVSHQYVNLGPKTINSTDNLYQLTREGYWTHIDLRIIWNTRSWENGKYTLTYKAYRWDHIEGLVQVFPQQNELDHITIIVDNSPVTALIHNVKYDSSNPNYDPGADGEIPECGIINLTNDSENLRFTITAWHPNGYLKNYIMDALYGKNRDGGVIKSEHYDGTSPPHWHGVEEQEFQSEDAEPGALQPWQTCAYQFRLSVWSRTTDGYHYIIWRQFSDHYYLDVGRSLCKGDFDNDGDVDGSDLAVFASEFGRTDCLPTQ